MSSAMLWSSVFAELSNTLSGISCNKEVKQLNGIHPINIIKV